MPRPVKASRRRMYNEVSAMDEDGNEDYRGGYGRPPAHTPFVRGQSGNPKGRPKGTLNLASLVRKALQETVTVTERGVRKTMPKIDVAIRQQINHAAAGDVRALKLLAFLLQ